MSLRIIRTHRTAGREVVVHAREGEFKQAFTFEFRPYFLVREEENVTHSSVTGIEHGYTSLDGEPLKRVYLRNPSDTPEVRKGFPRHWEADIPYARRFLVDKMLTSGFEFIGSDGNEIVPVDPGPPTDLVVAFLDIECYSTTTMPDPLKDPITCICVGVDGDYVSFILDDFNLMTQGKVPGKNGTWVVFHVSSEKELLQKFITFMDKLYPDVLSGWNI